MENKNNIPIVFSTDNNYCAYASVAIQSIIHNANSEYEYKIYILHSNLNFEYITLLQGMSTNIISVQCINVLHLIKNFNLYTRSYFSIEMYYRILIPELLTYNKVLYLDCDIICLSDLVELYNHDISGKLMGVIRDYGLDQNEKYPATVLNIANHQYFNSGILLINCIMFKQENIKEKFFKELEVRKDLKYPDQDLLNIICQGQVEYLDITWNYLWGYEHFCPTTNLYHTIFKRDGITLFDLADQRQSTIKIIHYTSKTKPWNVPDRDLAEYFWEYAKITPFFMLILINNIRKPAAGKNYQKAYTTILNSKSYKIGRIISFVPRFVVKILKR